MHRRPGQCSRQPLWPAPHPTCGRAIGFGVLAWPPGAGCAWGCVWRFGILHRASRSYKLQLRRDKASCPVLFHNYRQRNWRLSAVMREKNNRLSSHVVFRPLPTHESSKDKTHKVQGQAEVHNRRAPGPIAATVVGVAVRLRCKGGCHDLRGVSHTEPHAAAQWAPQVLSLIHI